ncbi:unnamed protein product, partial [Discosporangium mesarthrocarpum]
SHSRGCRLLTRYIGSTTKNHKEPNVDNSVRAATTRVRGFASHPSIFPCPRISLCSLSLRTTGDIMHKGRPGRRGGNRGYHNASRGHSRHTGGGRGSLRGRINVGPMCKATDFGLSSGPTLLQYKGHPSKTKARDASRIRDLIKSHTVGGVVQNSVGEKSGEGGKRVRNALVKDREERGNVTTRVVLETALPQQSRRRIEFRKATHPLSMFSPGGVPAVPAVSSEA